MIEIKRQEKKYAKIKLLFIKFEKTANGIIILKQDESYQLKIRIGKKYRYVGKDKSLETILHYGKRLAADFQIGFDEEVKVADELKVKSFKQKAEMKLDTTMFRHLDNKPYLFLGFGSIFLNEGNFEIKRNWEKIDGDKIFDLNDKKAGAAFQKCRELIKTYSDEIINKLGKEIVRLGSCEERDIMLMAIGKPPQIVVHEPEEIF